MADDSQERTPLHKAATWVGGATALLLALAGLGPAFEGIRKLFPHEVLPTIYSKPHGYLIKQAGDDWVETDKDRNLAIPWKEVSRSDGQTVLQDASREMYLRLPNKGGQVQWSHYNPMVWTDLYIAAPQAAAAP